MIDNPEHVNLDFVSVGLASKKRRVPNPPAPVRRFAVALSFPGEARERVPAIAVSSAGHLGRERVLYDRFHEAEFAGPSLDVYLQNLYHDHTELNVGRDYEAKEWCGLEWRAMATARKFLARMSTMGW